MASHDPVKFLLVDDVEENLLALDALLKRDGLKIFKARSGPEALELLLVHDFALALLDVQMPDMDGFELAEVMRSTERTRRVPIVFITAVATDERRRFRGFEAGAVDYLFKPVDPLLLRNKADVFFQLAKQRLELARQRDQVHSSAELLSEALRRIQAHTDNSPLAVVEFDSDMRIITWSQGAERIFGWSSRDVVGKRASDFAWVHDDDANAFSDFLSKMLVGDCERNVHVNRSYCKDGSVIHCEWYCSALLDDAGKLISINAQILDITDRKRAEETQQLLIGELNHRVKNMLATVQAIATQTSRHASEPEEFAANFSGRIRAMARAHSLLNSESSQVAELMELIENQLQLGAIDDSRLTANGPKVRLPAQTALHFALILHELGTNANKYGALSSPHGHVDISWIVRDGELFFKWEESGGPPVAPPRKRGFGTTLIEQSISAEGGSAEPTFGKDGITWSISFPLRRPDTDGSGLGEKNLRQAPATPPQPACPSVVQQAIAGKKVLIIEDEPLVALELADALQEAFVDVIGPASSAEQALHFIEESNIDAALLDGNLQGKPVDCVAAALAKRDVPFLFVSGYGRESLPAEFSDIKILGKPFTRTELLNAISELLGSLASRPAEPPGESDLRRPRPAARSGRSTLTRATA